MKNKEGFTILEIIIIIILASILVILIIPSINKSTKERKKINFMIMY